MLKRVGVGLVAMLVSAGVAVPVLTNATAENQIADNTNVVSASETPESTVVPKLDLSKEAPKGVGPIGIAAEPAAVTNEPLPLDQADQGRPSEKEITVDLKTPEASPTPVPSPKGPLEKNDIATVEAPQAVTPETTVAPLVATPEQPKRRVRRALDDAPAPVPDGAPGEPVLVRNGPSLLTFKLVQESAGIGQDGRGRCVINSANGYPIGDNTTTDHNVCAGGPARYRIEVNPKTKANPIKIELDPFWEIMDPDDSGVTRRLPTITANQANISGVSMTVGDNGKLIITASANNNQSAKFYLDIATVEPRRSSLAAGNPRGVFRLKLRAENVSEVASATPEPGAPTPEPVVHEPVPAATADHDLHVLTTTRLDQTPYNITSDPNPITINKRQYIGVQAYSNLTHTWNTSQAKVPQGGYNDQGMVYQVSEDEITRYTLEIPTDQDGLRLFPADQVLVSYDGGELEPAKVDADGNPYVEGRYGKGNGGYQRVPFKIYVPTRNLDKTAPVPLSTRLDVVDSEGNFTVVKNIFGEPSNIPALDGVNGLGNNEVDPGTGQACSFNTSVASVDAASRPLRASSGAPNNNCAVQTVDLRRCKPGDDTDPKNTGCAPSDKDDESVRGVDPRSRKNFWEFVPGAYDPPKYQNRAPISDSFVHVWASSLEGENNPSVCVSWKPKSQKFVYSGSDWDNFVQVGHNTSAPGIPSVFPFAKIYVTDKDVTNNGNPDCSDLSQWKLIYAKRDPSDPEDKTENVNIAPASAFGGMQNVSGFMIKLPGVPAQLRTTEFTYRATTGDPIWVSKNSPKVVHEDGQVRIYYPGNPVPQVVDPSTVGYEYIEGKTFYITTNYLRVANEVTRAEWNPDTQKDEIMRRDVWSPARKDFILQPTAKVTVDAGATANQVMADNVSESEVTMYNVPRIIIENGVPLVVNSEDNEGNPNQVILRYYPSRCLTVDTEKLQPGMELHGEADYSDPKNCGPDPSYYLERLYTLSDQPNTTGDPSKDPFFTPRWGEANASRTAATFQNWNNRIKIPVKTPPWASPRMKFDIYNTIAVTGMKQFVNPATGELTSPEQTALLPQEDSYNVGNPSVNIQSITVPNVAVLSTKKSISNQLNPIDDGFSQQLTLMNATAAPFGKTQFIDVFPYNGDKGEGVKWRSTDYHGEYWLRELPQTIVAKSPPKDQELDPTKVKDIPAEDMPVFYYTTQDPNTVSMCPTNADAEDMKFCTARAKRIPLDTKPSPADIWQPLTQEVIDQQGKPGAKHITAIRVDIPHVYEEAAYTINLKFKTWANLRTDQYDNDFGVSSVHMTDRAPAQAPIPNPSIIKAKVYAAKIEGKVYWDLAQSATIEPDDPPAEGYKVALLYEDGSPVLGEACTPTLNADGSVDPDSDCVPMTEPGPDGTPVLIRDYQGNPVGRLKRITYTDKDGYYAFDNVAKGTYKTEITLKNPRNKVLQAGLGKDKLVINDIVIQNKPPAVVNGLVVQEVNTANDYGLVVVVDLKVHKVNYDNKALPGARFSVFNDNDGNVGDLFKSRHEEGVPTPEDGQPVGEDGKTEIDSADFQWRNLGVNKWYWLAETKSPAGHELLAQPVRFKMNYHGEIEFGDGKSDFIIGSKGVENDIPFGDITVKDVDQATLPASGGRGVIYSLAFGTILLGAAVVLRRKYATQN
ncbi:hypothetical protein BK816_01405 [Boudabousia tangfeifanii]|uniref:SpaA-like prealbumin fold domain-containing protein n=2 Tax=Boudabousia tangfeifanii TaxID=1912795 RepID=A0A1D9MIJ9_9ACTO|nr:hypothetical protein BK816_01405 [Boudabousia tangfeifanii]